MSYLKKPDGALKPVIRVLDIVGRHFMHGPGVAIWDADTFESLGGDSLDLLEILMEVEDEFDINLMDEDTDAIKTVADLTALVERKLKEKKQ